MKYKSHKQVFDLKIEFTKNILIYGVLSNTQRFEDIKIFELNFQTKKITLFELDQEIFKVYPNLKNSYIHSFNKFEDKLYCFLNINPKTCLVLNPLTLEIEIKKLPRNNNFNAGSISSKNKLNLVNYDNNVLSKLDDFDNVVKEINFKNEQDLNFIHDVCEVNNYTLIYPYRSSILNENLNNDYFKFLNLCKQYDFNKSVLNLLTQNTHIHLSKISSYESLKDLINKTNLSVQNVSLYMWDENQNIITKIKGKLGTGGHILYHTSEPNYVYLTNHNIETFYNKGIIRIGVLGNVEISKLNLRTKKIELTITTDNWYRGTAPYVNSKYLIGTGYPNLIFIFDKFSGALLKTIHIDDFKPIFKNVWFLSDIKNQNFNIFENNISIDEDNIYVFSNENIYIYSMEGKLIQKNNYLSEIFCLNSNRKMFPCHTYLEVL